MPKLHRENPKKENLIRFRYKDARKVFPARRTPKHYSGMSATLEGVAGNSDKSRARNTSVVRRESTALHDSHVIDAHFGDPRRLTSTAAPTQMNIVCRMKAGHATA
jgi:hypothetical protein